MRPVLSYILCLFSLVLAVGCESPGKSPEMEDKLGIIDADELRGRSAVVPGSGRRVPGITLSRHGQALYKDGNDSTWSDRDLDDMQWARFLPKDSMPELVERHYWVRFHLHVDPRLKGVPLYLNAVSPAALDVFVNGRHLVERAEVHSIAPTTDLNSKPERIMFPITFAVDQRTEIIAVKLDRGDGPMSPRPRLALTLHATEAEGIVQEEVMHYGLFMGINVIIFLLAMIIWSLDRRDHSWLMLAVLSVVTAFNVLGEICAQFDLNMDVEARHVLSNMADSLEIVPSLLLILVLRRLLGRNTKWDKRAMFGTAALVLVVLVARVFLLPKSVHFTVGFNSREWEAHPAVLVAFVILALVMIVTAIWFFIAAIRLGMQLLRTKGYIRWIGAGALANVLLGGAIGMGLGISHLPTSSWLGILGQYCDYAALPITVAIFLAVRSSHHNKAVARQRDDLDREVHERTAELRQERDRSNELLLNILPQEVAEELKQKGAAEARHFEQASVLFTDFKGFTTMSEQVGPAELLQELNTCFKAFDDIIGRRGIEKIKTIGDAYMCAGGLPDPKSSSPTDVVLAALEMQDFMEKRRVERQALGRLAFSMRVGVHSGPVVAGIVGVKKFQYDIWGDTVNTASRMESTGEVGRVNISESTYSLVKDAPGLGFSPRGRIQVKGKGEMEMYFVHRT